MTISLPRRLSNYLILLLFGWTLLCCIALVIVCWDHHQEAVNFALETGRESLRKDLLYRRWNASHGGVYVPVSSTTPPNPYLSHLPHRDLATADGKQLTLINPSYMTRQVHELASNSDGSLGHITSLRPLRPENAPDPWEGEALQLMAGGAAEVSAINLIEGRPYMRVMIPFLTEQSCLKCHAVQGYKLGDQRGGLSVSIPLPDYWQSVLSQHWMAGLVMLAIWGSGASLLLWGGNRLRGHLERESEVLREIGVSERRHRQLVEHIDGIVWEVDFASFRFTYVSQQAEAILGYPVDEWHNLNFWVDHLHPDDRYWAMHYCLEQTKAGKLHSFEYRMFAQDGRVVWLRDLVSVEMVDEQPVTLRGVMLDITEKKKIELQLQEYRKAVEASRDLVCTVDRDYRYVLVNQAFLDLTRKEREAMVGKTVAEVFGKKVHDYIRPYFDQCLDGQPVSFEMERSFPKIGKRWLSCVYVPVIEKDEVTRVVAILRDVTEQRHAEQSLIASRQLAEDASRMKSEFLANMSHELRTPLNGILGMVQLLATTEMSEEQQEYVEVARKSGWNLLALLNDLLDLSRIEAGQLHLKSQPFNLVQLIEGLRQTFATQIAEQRIDYRSEIAADVSASVVGDETRLRQVLLNLVGNAVKFTPPGGWVSCAVRMVERIPSDGPVLEFCISDSGIGIDAELMERIFEPFVQGESAYRKRYQGAGLGLPIVRKLVQMMNGSISVDSTVGRGTTFTVRLPCGGREDGVLPPTPPAPKSMSRVGLRVLVVEDNQINCLAIVNLLKYLGHTAASAENGLAALALLAREPFDLVLLDIQMPVMDGVEAIGLLRRGEYDVLNPQIPVVAMTAYAMTGDRETFIAAGMDDYLAKPVLEEDLMACLNRVVRAGAGLPAATSNG